jgi:PKD repeat protein
LSTVYTYADEGVYEVTLTVTDDDGGFGTDTLTVTIIRTGGQAPEIIEISVTDDINENDIAILSGLFIDPDMLDSYTLAIDWGDGSSDTFVLDVGDRSFSAEHQYLDDEPSGTEQDDYTIVIVLTDIEGGQDTASTAITVNNVAPEIVTFSTGSSGCEGTTNEHEVSIFAEFTDVGILDSHTATINWGDGTSTTGQVTEADGTGSVTASHIYTSGGIYNITLIVTDDDTGEDIQVAIKAITGVKVTDGVLQIIGTCGDDHVTVNMTSSCKSSQLKVHANFLPHKGKGNKNNGRGFEVFDAAEINKIVVLVCDGNDIVTIAGNIKITTLIDGGAGNDKLKGGAGADIILGAEGNDMLIGGRGRDILIGGDGCDRIIGNAGDDILIGGTTLFDIDDSNLGQAQVILGQEFDEALMSILAEWNSERDFTIRMNNLIDGSGSDERLNSLYFLQKGVTVFDDGRQDHLTGSAGKNWFLLFDFD